MALPTFPIAPEGALTQSAATVAYSNLREGMAATARVMSQPAKREALREAYTLLGQQLNLPLTVFKEAAMTATSETRFMRSRSPSTKGYPRSSQSRAWSKDPKDEKSSKLPVSSAPL